MFIEQPPWFFRALYPQAIFRMDPNERAVYLTFDDGPIPEVTPWVLELLKKHDIKATFFMVGDNILQTPGRPDKVVDIPKHQHTTFQITHRRRSHDGIWLHVIIVSGLIDDIHTLRHTCQLK